MNVIVLLPEEQKQLVDEFFIYYVASIMWLFTVWPLAA